MDNSFDLPHLPPRAADANKGTFGKVLVTAGSRGMAGAAILCGSAALRSGAGLVRLAVPGSIQAVVAAGNPCCTTAALAEDQGVVSPEAAPEWREWARENTVLAFGPGMGRGPGVDLLLRMLLQAARPAVVDADGLNALAGHQELLAQKSAAVVLTPHPGEFARLAGRTVAEIQRNREPAAREFAAQYQVVVVLKGAGTVVTDGNRSWINDTGNPGMATGGTGDVLTGVIAALLAQGLSALEAARLGVRVHGLAGDLARDEVGEISLIATDLLAALPRAFLSLAGSGPRPVARG